MRKQMQKKKKNCYFNPNTNYHSLMDIFNLPIMTKSITLLNQNSFLYLKHNLNMIELLFSLVIYIDIVVNINCLT